DEGFGGGQTDAAAASGDERELVQKAGHGRAPKLFGRRYAIFKISVMARNSGPPRRSWDSFGRAGARRLGGVPAKAGIAPRRAMTQFLLARRPPSSAFANAMADKRGGSSPAYCKAQIMVVYCTLQRVSLFMPPIRHFDFSCSRRSGRAALVASPASGRALI